MKINATALISNHFPIYAALILHNYQGRREEGHVLEQQLYSYLLTHGQCIGVSVTQQVSRRARVEGLSTLR